MPGLNSSASTADLGDMAGHHLSRGARRRAWIAGLLFAACLATWVLIGSAPAASTQNPASRGQESYLRGLRLVDYFPAHAGWASMWSDWSAARTERDFARIEALHANGVRIIVSVPAFGFPHIDPVMLARLHHTIAIAAAHGLRSELTLFDGWHEYGRVGASKRWLSQLLPAVADRRRLVYIDLQNELPASEDPAALAWAQSMLPFLQSYDDGVPVTISSSISSGVGPLAALVHGLGRARPDLYDVHYYGNPAQAFTTLSRAKNLAGGTPVFVGETGFATSPSYGWAEGLAPGPRSLDSYQDYYFRMVEFAARAAGLPDASPWILYDMPHQGDTAWGHHMGILHPDGSRKPAARTLAGIFSGAVVGTGFDSGFESWAGKPPVPTIWRRWLPTEASFSVDRTVAHEGVASARIEDARGDHETGCPAFYVAPITAVRQGRTYTASSWVKGADARGTSRVALVWTDARGRYVATTSSESMPTGTTGWRKITVSAQPPPGARSLELDLQVCENPGTTWFDDAGLAVSG